MLARAVRVRARCARAQPWPRRRRVRVKMVRILYMNRAPKARTRVESRAGSRAAFICASRGSEFVCKIFSGGFLHWPPQIVAIFKLRAMYARFSKPRKTRGSFWCPNRGRFLSVIHRILYNATLPFFIFDKFDVSPTGFLFNIDRCFVCWKAIPWKIKDHN